MNWEKIMEDYPISIENFDNFLYVNGILPSKRRYLYDFFDSNGLFIEIRKEADKCRYIINGSTILYISRFIYDCRRDAEDSAFEKCLEILENKFKVNAGII